MKEFTPQVRGLVLAALVSAGGVASLAILLDSEFSWSLAVGFGLVYFLVEQFPITLKDDSSYSVSVSFVVTIAATIVAGPAEAALANAFGFITIRDLHRTHPIKLAFNGAQIVITAGLGGLAYLATGGPIGQVHGIFPNALIPLLACTAVNFLVNTTLVSAVVAMSQQRRIISVWREQYASLPAGYFAFASLGLLLAVLYLEIGWGSVVFLLLPLLVARNAFQASVKMQGAYDATVRAVMRAIEAKDPYTRGHAERVAQLSELVAREYGLSKDVQRQVRYAALMHDVGKLVVESKILKKPGKLTAEEYEHMKIHPIRGHTILGGIDLLKGVIDGVRHHHERLDGTGYPDRLTGEEIPLTARLIMVADAFDAMTSTRTYRPPKTIDGALEEIRRCAGSQFDADALAALERAIEKYGWEPSPEAREAAEADAPLLPSVPAFEVSGDARAATL